MYVEAAHVAMRHCLMRSFQDPLPRAYPLRGCLIAAGVNILGCDISDISACWHVLFAASPSAGGRAGTSRSCRKARAQRWSALQRAPEASGTWWPTSSAAPSPSAAPSVRRTRLPRTCAWSASSPAASSGSSPVVRMHARRSPALMQR